ncbi:MAG: amidohydrolase family protein, partial [Actinomycetota bacterium]
PHGQNLRELEFMADLGMSPVEVMTATTQTAAELMDLPDLGAIDVGRRADLVIATGEELDVRGLRDRITAVYQDGALVSTG